MAIDKTNLTTQVQARIDGLTGSETLKDLLMLSKAAEGLDVTRTALDSAIEAQLNGFDGTSELKDLLVGNKSTPSGIVTESFLQSELASFSPIKSIQRGLADIQTSSNIQVPIGAVDMAKSFVNVSSTGLYYREEFNPSGYWAMALQARGWLNSPTVLYLNAQYANSTYRCRAAWEVVEFK